MLAYLDFGIRLYLSTHMKMYTSNITFSRYRRFTILVVVVSVAFLAAACEGFYTDSLPTPDIAQPTPANVQVGDPAEILEATAREALAAKLGIDPSAPQMILFEGETWTERNPGCYPASSTITGAYLIPGYRLLLQQDGIYYEFNADQGAGTGALCESTLQLVPVEPSYTIVTPSESSEPDFDLVHIIRSEEDVAEFNTVNSNTAAIGVDQIDFDEELLVGGWVNASPNPEAVRAYRSEEGSSIIIEVAVPEDLIEEATDDPSQIWALVDITESDTTYEFIVLE